MLNGRLFLPVATVHVFNITQASSAARTFQYQWCPQVNCYKVSEVSVKDCSQWQFLYRHSGPRRSPAVYSTSRKSLPTITVISEQQHREVQDVGVSIREYFPYRMFIINWHKRERQEQTIRIILVSELNHSAKYRKHHPSQACTSCYCKIYACQNSTLNAASSTRSFFRGTESISYFSLQATSFHSEVPTLPTGHNAVWREADITEKKQ